MSEQILILIVGLLVGIGLTLSVVGWIVADLEKRIKDMKNG